MKTTTETNKIIAEFMGNRNYLYNNDKSSMYFILTNTAGEELIVNYNNDWGLLMEVVEKITILEEFQEWEFNSLFWEVFCQIDITEIYNQVVLFIEYYNEIGVKN